MNSKELKNFRKMLGLGQKKLAEYLTVNIRTYQRYESGELIVPKWVTKLLELKRDGVT